MSEGQLKAIQQTPVPPHMPPARKQQTKTAFFDEEVTSFWWLAFSRVG